MIHSLNIERVDHVAINVTDVERARAFYGGLLGLPEIPRPESFDFAGAWYRIGTTDLHLIRRIDAPPPIGQHFALWVADVRAAARALESAGVAVQWEQRYKIRGIDRFFIRDPDQNRIEIQGNEARK